MAEKTTSFTGPIVVGLNDKKGEIRLTDGKDVNEAKYLSIAAPENITSNTTLTFPDGAGTAGQILSTDGNGGLNWVNDSAGNPAGTNGQVQTNDGGTFGAISEGTSGEVLTSNGVGAPPTFQTPAAAGIAAVVDDTTPQLGGNLDLNSNSITGTGNLDIANGTIKLDGNYPVGPGQVAMGDGALSSSTGGTYNTAIGNTAMFGSTVGGHNVAVGHAALDANNGSRNVAVGSNSLGATGSNNDNVAIGIRAMFSNGNGSENIAIGSKTMDQGNGGTQNVAIGHKALELGGNQQQNVAIGWQALKACSGGFQNTAIGDDAMNLSVNAWGTVAIGDGALQQVEGVVNIGIGQSVGNSLTSGARNVLIGRNAANSLTTGDDNIVIGTQAQPSSATVSNEITLGGSGISTLRCNVTSITALSDARDKKDVEDANIGLDFINDLRPVKFVWDTRDGAKKDIKEVGFIAQELDEVQQKHGVEDHLQLVLKNNPDKLEASQGKLIPILVQAIKDLKKELDELKKD